MYLSNLERWWSTEIFVSLKMTRFTIFAFTLLALLKLCDFQGFTYINPIRFPLGNPFMGIFVALAIPVDVPGHEGLFFAYHIEAVYLLPRHNDTVLTYPPIINKRSLDRVQLYKNAEKYLQRQGYDGKNCLIRSICEAAEYSTKGTGVLGDILHILLSPSASRHENKTREYRKAEIYGRKNGNCRRYEKLCPTSLLGSISTTGEFSDKQIMMQ